MGAVVVGTWGLPAELEAVLRAAGAEPRPWRGGPLDDAVALIVDLGSGGPDDAPDVGLPAVAITEGEAPAWALGCVRPSEASRALVPALLRAVAAGAAGKALREERECVGDLLDLVCHDLRNPLAAIRANLGVLESSGIAPSLLEAVSDSMMAADGALRIVENLSVVSACEAGRARGTRGVSDARAAVAEAIRRARRASEAASIPIGLELPDRSMQCGCAPQALGAVLDNLVGAALRYAPRGSDVRVHLGRADGAVRVTVSEAGAPVPADVAPGLFERTTQRLAKKTSAGRYGRGLGLYVAALLARSCGATLTSVQLDGRHAYRLDLPPVGEEG